jgi:hypothetical protein
MLFYAINKSVSGMTQYCDLEWVFILECGWALWADVDMVGVDLVDVPLQLLVGEKGLRTVRTHQPFRQQVIVHSLQVILYIRCDNELRIRSRYMTLNSIWNLGTLKQSCGSGSVSGSILCGSGSVLGIRIRIGNPDPGSGSRGKKMKIKKYRYFFSWFYLFL